MHSQVTWEYIKSKAGLHGYITQNVRDLLGIQVLSDAFRAENMTALQGMRIDEKFGADGATEGRFQSCHLPP